MEDKLIVELGGRQTNTGEGRLIGTWLELARGSKSQTQAVEVMSWLSAFEIETKELPDLGPQARQLGLEGIGYRK